MHRFVLTAVLCALLADRAWAINGNALVLNSGSNIGSAARLNDNGYAGTYITLAEQGLVTLRINAQGQSFSGVAPRLNLVVDDSNMGWDVGDTASNYEQTLNLPAGTHFVRAEFNNDGGTSRALSINSLDVIGATVNNVNSNANALAAAATYTENYRKGHATIALVGAVPGTHVERQTQASCVQLRHNGPQQLYRHAAG